MSQESSTQLGILLTRCQAKLGETAANLEDCFDSSTQRPLVCPRDMLHGSEWEVYSLPSVFSLRARARAWRKVLLHGGLHSAHWYGYV